MPLEKPPRPDPRKPTPAHAPAPPAFGSAPMPASAALPRDPNPPNQGCTRPPIGWYCSREPGHKGPCAARPVVSSTLSGLGRLPAPPPLPRVDPPAPKSDPFPADESPTPIKRVGPFSKVEFRGPGASQTARTFRNYDALSEENKRLVDGLVLALRGTVDGGR